MPAIHRLFTSSKALPGTVTGDRIALNIVAGAGYSPADNYPPYLLLEDPVAESNSSGTFPVAGKEFLADKPSGIIVPWRLCGHPGDVNPAQYYLLE